MAGYATTCQTRWNVPKTDLMPDFWLHHTHPVEREYGAVTGLNAIDQTRTIPNRYWRHVRVDTGNTSVAGAKGGPGPTGSVVVAVGQGGGHLYPADQPKRMHVLFVRHGGAACFCMAWQAIHDCVFFSVRTYAPQGGGACVR